jgi:outer membrane protein assembly factor BamB
MKRPLWTVVVVLALFPSWFGAPVFGQARDLYPNTPDEVIVSRTAGQAKPIWQIALGPALIEDMTLLGPDRLLVGLRKDFPSLPNLDYMLVDTAAGNVLWRFSRDKIKGEYDNLLVLKDLLLFRVDGKRSAALLALDTGTGKQKWSVSKSGEEVQFIPLVGTGSALAVNPGPGSVDLACLDLETGREAWKKAIVASGGADLPQPLPIGEDVLVFYDGLQRLAARDGRTVYARPDIPFDAASPPPQLEGGEVLWVVDSGNRLSALDPASGETRWAVPLPSRDVYTQIYPLDGHLYLRGIDASGAPQIARLDPGDGKLLWAHRCRETSVSNLIESDGVLYFGTPSLLVALGAGDGKELFSVQVTTTGRAFPIRLRKIGERLVYIGELVVAAYDAKTGKIAYKHGTTPGSEELHLNGLDAAAPNLKEALQEARKAAPGDKEAGRMISLATSESRRYQNLSRTYADRSYSAARSGDVWGSTMNSMKSTFAAHEASLQAMTAAAISITNLAMMYRQFLYAKSIKTFIERQSLFRKSILASYAQAETEEFAYRPHLVYRDPADTFSALSVVHLPTGKRTETILSPHYLSYGLWQIVDFDKGIVYHSNIGLDPSRYELSESRMYYPYKKARTVNTFLIAQPVKVPR